MKTSENKNSEQSDRGERDSNMKLNNEELLYKMPAVLVVLLLPSTRGNITMPLVKANRGLLVHTGYDPEGLISEKCDFFARLLCPEDIGLINTAIDYLTKNPFEEIDGLSFRIITTWKETLWVNCGCRLFTSNDGSCSYLICNWQVCNPKTLPLEIMRNCLKTLDRMTYQKKLDELTKREIEVLTYIGQGLTTKEIAPILYISVKTVETHIKSIEAKLDIHSINALTVFAITAGLY